MVDNVEGAERDFGALHAAIWNNSQLTWEGVARGASLLCHHGDQVGWFNRIAKGHASLDSFVWEFCFRFVVKETGQGSSFLVFPSLWVFTPRDGDSIPNNYADIIRQIIRATKQEIIDWYRHSTDRFGLSGTLDVLPYERLAIVQLQHLSRIAAHICDTREKFYPSIPELDPTAAPFGICRADSTFSCTGPNSESE